MKKIIILITAITMLLCSCSSPTDNWQTINVQCGTMKIPNEWSLYTENETMYIMNNDTTVMISYDRNNENNTIPYSTDLRYRGFITSAVLSNSAAYGTAKYFYLGTNVERYYLSLTETKDFKYIEFVVLDESVSRELLINMAKSFVLEPIYE